ncbi:MerR family transcriptional regulator [Labedaea rhizosphaerae]|uniref:DNA-binding transcriptional MerR regulator n=1 Tax=Labedaea rhizosphaerae TaxID=598644 RepID=A0A4R6SEK8_LABRH|nr:MerR family transcriptional regulator [Labedaea rhizosphaerae]TDP98167.1 DNA-binding transcriptional MerR regulator [Labedaea rhizosphaerae]
MGETWKVGRLAEATGLSVRTLHHYDQIGLLTPSARTASGHRLYTEVDVARLHAIITLRDLKVPLPTIATLLGGEPDVLSLLEGHRRRIDDEIAVLRELRGHLAVLTETVRAQGPSASALLASIGEVVAARRAFDDYFTPAQRASLADRQEAGQAAAAQWPALIARVRAEMSDGTSPRDPRVQALAREWSQLLESFHGKDPAMRAALYRMHTENSAQIAARGGPDQEMIDYIAAAMHPDD